MKKNRTLDALRREVAKAQSQGYEAIGMSYSGKPESHGSTGKDVFSLGEADSFPLTSQTDISLSAIADSKNPETCGRELFEYEPDCYIPKDSPAFAQKVIPVKYEDVGSPGRGYIPWGAWNRLPNFIFDTAWALPYTSRSLQFMRDEIVGMGVEFTYRWTRYNGGTVTTKEIPYRDAGVLLEGRIRELEKERREQGGVDGSTVSMSSLDAKGKARPGTIEHELERLREEYAVWERVDAEVREFERNNNLYKHEMACMTDFCPMEMYFPLIGLNRGKPGQDWQPKIVALRHIPCVAARVEEMDEDRNINYVYYSDRWRTSSPGMYALTPELNEIVAYPALPETGTISSLASIVERKRKVGVRSRPTWFCIPRRMPSMNSLYYTRPTWWSIYTSRLYDYAATLIADRAAARRNSTMWGKIIMVNHEYLRKLWDSRGCDTAEKKDAFRKKLKENIDNFLKNRDKNGSTVMFESVVAPNGSDLWDSVKIIDVPMNNNATATANKTELSEISNAIFLTMGIHTLIVGNDIASGNSGTAHRELDLLKQKQLAPMQQDYLNLLNFIRDWNNWDPEHGVWRSKQMSLTTLDASKTGVTTINNEGEKTR